MAYIIITKSLLMYNMDGIDKILPQLCAFPERTAMTRRVDIAQPRCTLDFLPDHVALMEL